MNGFLEDLKGSFGILSNADVMSYLLRGLMFTLVISVIAIVFSLLLGVALALARNYCTRGPARVLQKMASIYIELFRNTPLMLWMFVCFVMCPAPAVSKSFAEMLGMSSTGGSEDALQGDCRLDTVYVGHHGGNYPRRIELGGERTV